MSRRGGEPSPVEISGGLGGDRGIQAADDGHGSSRIGSGLWAQAVGHEDDQRHVGGDTCDESGKEETGHH
jgi:hypothetical protein